MTNEEAIKTLKVNYPDACFEQLREAVDIANSALEKQILKKVRIEHLPKYGRATFCPNCNRMDVGLWDYCPSCGQRIDWSEKDE